MATLPVVDFCSSFDDPVPAASALQEVESSKASRSTITWLWTTFDASPMASPC